MKAVTTAWLTQRLDPFGASRLSSLARADDRDNRADHPALGRTPCGRWDRTAQRLRLAGAPRRPADHPPALFGLLGVRGGELRFRMVPLIGSRRTPSQRFTTFRESFSDSHRGLSLTAKARQMKK